MLDKNLQNWRRHQQYKRKMKLANMAANNAYSCLVLLDNNFIPANLQIINNLNEKYVHIECPHRRAHVSISFKIPLTSLRGFHQENEQIILTTLEEEEPLVLQFGNADTLDAAFAAIDEFQSEGIKLPTPPISSSSTSDEADN